MVAQGIGLINPYPIDDVPTETGDDMEEVVNDLSLRTMLLHLQIERGVHVHGHGFDLPATLRSQQLEEGANSFATIAFANPQHAHPIRVHDHRGVAMPFVQRELVHHQTTDVVGHELAMQSFQATVVNLLDRVPVQPRQLGHMGNR